VTVNFWRRTLLHGVSKVTDYEALDWIQLAQDRDQWRLL